MVERKVIAESDDQSIVVLLDGSEEILRIDEKLTDDGALITLTGKLRSDTQHNFQDEVNAFISEDLNVILDFKGVTFLSQAAIGAMMDIQKRIDKIKKGAMILRSIPAAVMGKLENYSDLFDIR